MQSFNRKTQDICFRRSMMRSWLASSALSLSLLINVGAIAQTSIEDARTDPVTTSTIDGGGAGDVDVSSTGSIVVTDGAALTIDSDNSATIAGRVGSDDSDDTTAINLVGGNSGNLTLSGTVSLLEDYTPSDTDSDNIADETFASGSGRTGILISGASPFIGNVTAESGSSIAVEGNNSYAFRLMEGAGLTGNISFGGGITMSGDNSRAVSIEDKVIGNLATSGTIAVTGQSSSAVVITGDIDGQYVNDGSISASGYRFNNRPSASGRELLDEDDFWQAGSAVQVNGNVSGGVYLRETTTVTDNDDGTTTESITARSSITQYGQAPAVLIDGQGTPIAIGIIAAITDPADEDYDADLQYAFVNQGTLSAYGIYDDINATAFQVSDASLAGGINNTRTMQAATYRSGDNDAADATGATGLARVIVFGSGAIADSINNSGVMLASVSEAIDAIYADPDNIIPARQVRAVAIDIAADAEVAQLINSGSIIALLSGREGEAVALLDQSGSLTYIENTGTIGAGATLSDPYGDETTDFNLVALDLTANTSGVTLNQLSSSGDNAPAINGSILLGSGDDTVNIEAGAIIGDLALGGGVNALSLSGGSGYSGLLTDDGGQLALSVTGGSTLHQNAAVPINTTSAYFDDTSIFRPTLDGSTGEASTLIASGDITFDEGATISPSLINIIETNDTQFTILDAGGTLAISPDSDNLSGIDTPFMYNTIFDVPDSAPNSLIVTLERREVGELGLDAVQTASFNSAFNALENNTDLANAMISITTESEFNQAINQLLPEFSAASRQFIMANVDGAVGAVGSHLDNARYSQVKPGSVWLEEFGYYADRDLAGLSEQYRGHGFGLTGGIDTALGPLHTVGLNLGFASTQIEDVVGFDDPMDVMTVQGGLYAGFEAGRFSIDGYAGGGYNNFDQTRRIEIGTYSDTSKGEWSGTHANGSLRAGYDIWLGQKYWLRPVVSADYLRLEEEAYTETGPTGVALDIDKRTSEVGGVTAMMNLGARWFGKRTWLRPALRAGYRHEFINHGVDTRYRFAGLDEYADLTTDPFPEDAFLLGFTLAAGSRYSSVGLDFDTDIRDGFIRNTGRLVVRLIF